MKSADICLREATTKECGWLIVHLDLTNNYSSFSSISSKRAQSHFLNYLLKGATNYYNMKWLGSNNYWSKAKDGRRKAKFNVCAHELRILFGFFLSLHIFLVDNDFWFCCHFDCLIIRCHIQDINCLIFSWIDTNSVSNFD